MLSSFEDELGDDDVSSGGGEGSGVVRSMISVQFDATERARARERWIEECNGFLTALLRVPRERMGGIVKAHDQLKHLNIARNLAVSPSRDFATPYRKLYWVVRDNYY